MYKRVQILSGRIFISSVQRKSAETVCGQAKALCENTGYEELSLASLSTSDHSEIADIIGGLIPYTEKEHVNLSLPSLRVDNFSKELMDEIKRYAKADLLFLLPKQELSV